LIDGSNFAGRFWTERLLQVDSDAGVALVVAREEWVAVHPATVRFRANKSIEFKKRVVVKFPRKKSFSGIKYGKKSLRTAR